MLRLTLLALALFIAVSPVRGEEPPGMHDDEQSLEALKQIDYFCEKNRNRNVRIVLFAGFLGRRVTQDDLVRRRPTQDDLVHLKGFPELKSVVLNSIRDLDDAGLARLKVLKTVTFLRLPYKHNVSADGIEHLGEMKQLRTLELGYSNLTADELQRLRHLLPDTAIRDAKHPVSGESPLRYDDARSLEALSKISIILKLNERGNVKLAWCGGCARTLPRPTQDDLVHLKGLPELESVAIFTIHEFDAAGLTHLTGLKTVTSLKLSYKYRFSDAGIAQFGKMNQLKALRSGGLTAIQLRRLRQLLPDTVIR